MSKHLNKRARKTMEWAIFKAEEEGIGRSEQIQLAAEALHEEYPYIPFNQALIHATEMHKKLADKKQGRQKGKIEFYNCGNCGHNLHFSAKYCPYCKYPWPKKTNWRICAACNQKTRIYARRKYNRYNKWDKIRECLVCGGSKSFSFNRKTAPESSNQEKKENNLLITIFVAFVFVVSLLLLFRIFS